MYVVLMLLHSCLEAELTIETRCCWRSAAFPSKVILISVPYSAGTRRPYNEYLDLGVPVWSGTRSRRYRMALPSDTVPHLHMWSPPHVRPAVRTL